MEAGKEIVEQIKNQRRNILISLIAVVVASSIVILESTDLTFSTDLSRIFAIGAAAVLSIVIVLRQGIAGIFGRAYLAISIGILLWFAAETTWGYYELVLKVERPFPSLADAFWLSGYVPIGYHLFAMSRFYGRGIRKYKIAIVIAGITIFSGLYIQQLTAIFQGSQETSLLGLGISITYPVVDAILFMPAIVIVWNAGRGYLTSIPWIFIAWISTGIADTLLGIVAIQNFEGNAFVVNLFYLVAYLGMAIGLWWYNQFFILSKKKIQRQM